MELKLREVHALAIAFKDYEEFKSEVDRIYNGTPRTVVDSSQYKLTKLSEPLEIKCKGEYIKNNPINYKSQER
jgi:hypothetical protein